MSTYGNDSSDDGSSDEIGFPKTPGQPLAAHHSDEHSDNESNKSSSASSDSDSEHSDNDNNARPKSDSDNDNDNGDKKSASGESDLGNKSSESSDSENGNEIIRPVPSNSNSPQDQSNNNNDGNRSHRESDSSSDDEERSNKKASSDSEDNEAEFTRERKRKQALDSSDDDSDINNEGEQKDKNTTAKDLFGDLSDEDDENKSDQEERNTVRKKARIEDDDEEMPPVDKDVINDIFGDDDEVEEGADRERVEGGEMGEDEEEAPLPERRIEVEIPRIMSNLGNGIHFVKLPNFLSIDTHPYDPLTYEDEIDEDEVHDDEGRARLKLKVENTIRWRNVAQDDGSLAKESNARIVKWSDGSMSILLGDEIFDIQTLNLLPGENNHLYVRQGTGLQGQAVFRTKLTFRPFSTESFTHRKLTLSLADRSQKTQKICVLPSVGKDPEAHRSEMIKKEESKLKASILKESKQKRVKDRFFGRGPNSAYLENDEDDDESISISKIKSQYKRGPTFSGSHFSGDESKSESDLSDDDSDLDIFEKKKTTEKRKIVESDED